MTYMFETSNIDLSIFCLVILGYAKVLNIKSFACSKRKFSSILGLFALNMLKIIVTHTG